MAIAFYMDHNVPRQITQGLRLRTVDVITAHEDGTQQLNDAALLDRATQLNRVLFSRDDDLLVLARQRQKAGEHFSGVVYAHQLRVSIGACIHNLELIAQASEPGDLTDSVQFLPL